MKKISKKCGIVFLCAVLLLSVLTACSSIGFRSSNSTDSNKNVEKKAEAIKEIIDEIYYESKDIDDDKMTEYTYKGIVASLGDPYSAYYTKKEFAEMNKESSGEYCGIGVVVQQNAETKVITVVKVYQGGPGNKAGLLPGDIITAVNGKDVTSDELDKVVTVMKGEPGTTVKVTVNRDGKTLDFNIERAKINVEYVTSKMLKDSIGYISVDSFEKKTTDQFKNAIDNLEKQKMKGVVIDLRDNPGGDLDAVISMLQYLLPEGDIMSVRYKNGKKDVYKSKGEHVFKKPIVILANENSASASELFIGALKDYDMMTLVGTKTFGKGIMQQFFPFKDGSAVKLTVGKYYSPKGNNIHKKGFEPDVKVEQPEEVRKKINLEDSEDVQLQKAIEVMKEKIK